MGSMIVGDTWLLTLSEQGRLEQGVAGRLLRMQILLTSRTGHCLLLGTEYNRRAICASARFGVLAGIVVECTLCGCKAKLSEWERSALATSAEREQARKASVQRGYGYRALYLARCPGPEYMRDAIASPNLP